ncbi:MAG: nucleotidyltransferase family protein [Motiliproteus sp.]|nr:nucleotidyltransferase family protein [Motiliproteus sp.]MCW9054015.1 nucleotidyltransferase family protein [Motiliproteus sp.]
MDQLAVLIMAAGQSSRFNGCKALAEIDGKPMLQHLIDRGNAVYSGHVFSGHGSLGNGSLGKHSSGQESAGHVYVASGGWHPQLQQAFNDAVLTSAKLVHCATWSKGLGHSIAEAVATLSDRYQHLLLLLGDQLALTDEDLQNITNQLGSADIVCSFYGGKRGAPALFSASCYPSLLELQGDQGAKQLLYSDRFSLLEVPIAAAAIDIDQPEDLERFC